MCQIKVMSVLFDMDLSVLTAELKELVGLALPISLNCILNITMATVDLMFVGHLNSAHLLAACALANVYFTLVTFPLNGYLTALDTRLGQAYGRKDFKNYGDNVQTALYSVNVGMVGLVLALYFAEDVFLACGQDPMVSRFAGEFVGRLISGLWPYCMCMVIMKFLNAQKLNTFVAVFNLVSNILNVFFNWLLVHHLEMGIVGSPYATSLSRWVQFLLNTTYLWWVWDDIKPTWPQWDVRVCNAMLPDFIRLAIPGAAMLAVPTFAYEISTFLSGLLSVEEMGANSILINFNAVLFMGSLFGLSIAGCIRVGHVIGAGLPGHDIRYTCEVMVAFVSVVMFVVALASTILRRQVGYMFTGDESIIAIIEDVEPVQSFLLIVNAPALAYQAILLALGKQETSFWVNVIGFWVCGIPVGAFLTFDLDMGVAGLWWGIVTGMFVMMFANKWLVERVDFDNLEEEGGSGSEREKAALKLKREQEWDPEATGVMYTEALRDTPSERAGLLGGHTKSTSSLVVPDEDSFAMASPVGTAIQMKRMRKGSMGEAPSPGPGQGKDRSGSYGSMQK